MTHTFKTMVFRPMSRTMVWLACIVLVSISAGNTLQAQERQLLDSIVALVDDDIILQSELDLAIKGITDKIRQQDGDMPPKHLLEKQVLERLIIRRLQLQRAFVTGIRVSDNDIDQTMLRLSQQNNLTLMQMRQVIEADGESFVEFRQNISEEMMTERLRQRVIKGMDPITDTEIEILLASDLFNSGEYNISHILIALPEGATPQVISAQESKVNNIYQQLTEGLDFASAAISYSRSQEALEGGLVGWRDLNSIPITFSEAIKNMRAGQFTVPIRSSAGFHIVKVNDFRDRSLVMATEYHALHIMIEVNDLIGPRDAMQTIREIHKRLQDGEDFETIAKENSNDISSANLGGDMGWFAPAAYGERMEQTLAAMKDGDISEPFQTDSNWHIIKRLGMREKDVTAESMRNAARNNLRQQRMDIEIEQFLQQMHDEAFIEIRLPS